MFHIQSGFLFLIFPVWGLWAWHIFTTLSLPLPNRLSLVFPFRHIKSIMTILGTITSYFSDYYALIRDRKAAKAYQWITCSTSACPLSLMLKIGHVRWLHDKTTLTKERQQVSTEVNALLLTAESRWLGLQVYLTCRECQLVSSF